MRNPQRKCLLSGNEAIARGAYEAGVTVAAGYPGTPSTEILERLAEYSEVYAEWAPNEKVALEVVIGASLAGARALTAMKHVGLNVAADPLMVLAYIGVKGGVVIVSADDPGMHSSQNEQDNRFYARFAQIPLLEPSDSQEAKDFASLAFWLSEEYDTPVLLRTTTRVSHGKGLVTLGERRVREVPGFRKDPAKYITLPAHARKRHPLVLERMQRLSRLADEVEINRLEWGDPRIGVITSGVAYQYAKEVLPDASYLKLGLSYPLPEGRIREFAAVVETLYVVEELEPFLEDELKARGFKVIGKEAFPRVGELDPRLVAEGFRRAGGIFSIPRHEAVSQGEEVLPRPPVLCSGCPYLGVFYVLGKLQVITTGDIGCYTLGAFPPLSAMDTCVCMGASIGNAMGLEKALPPGSKKKVVAVIGDSTFLHSGITGLMDAVYNKGTFTVIILDNRTTAMTGGQDHPATGVTLKGERTKEVDLEALCRSLGVERVRVVDPYDLGRLRGVLKEEVAAPSLSVVISRGPCILLDKAVPGPLMVNTELCNGCRLCLKLGCPSLSLLPLEGEREKGRPKAKVAIDPVTCTGCALCVELCKPMAIRARA